MSSFTGYVTYLKFVAGSTKGGVNQGDLINGVFALGDQKKLQTYTSSKVEQTAVTMPATSSDKKVLTLNWAPVVGGSVLLTETVGTGDEAVTYYYFDVKGSGNTGTIYETTTRPSVTTVMKADGMIETIISGDTTTSVGTINYGYVRANPATAYQPPVGSASGSALANVAATIEFTTLTHLTAATFDSVTYVYNNEFVPQNDIPLINMEMQGIPLVAKARRIAIYYSQIAAFQAKTDYDMDMQGQLAEKAVGELSYEIDSEIVNFLYEMGTRNPLVWNGNNIVFNRTQPVGVSLAEHYESFRQVLDLASAQIYNATGGRFGANYIVVGADVIGILHFLKGFTAAPAKTMNGPYFAGTLDGFKVFVSPQLRYNGTSTPCFVGFNGETLETSAAVYAPYMPIVPTAQLQGPDGGTSQGFSTLYDLKELNPQLVCGFAVAGDPFAAFGTAAVNPFYTTSVSI